MINSYFAAFPFYSKCIYHCNISAWAQHFVAVLDFHSWVRHWQAHCTRSSYNFFHQREGKTIKINNEELYDACGAQVDRVIAQSIIVIDFHFNQMQPRSLSSAYYADCGCSECTRSTRTTCVRVNIITCPAGNLTNALNHMQSARQRRRLTVLFESRSLSFLLLMREGNLLSLRLNGSSARLIRN